MSLIPAMFQYVKKMVGANDEKQIAFAPLATPFTNEDFLFMNSEIFQQEPAKFYSEILEFSQKANSVIKKANIWEIESSDFLYELYDKILRDARLIENRVFTEAELLAQENAKKVLFEADNTPTAAFKTYKTFEQQYNDITKKIEDHKRIQPASPQSEIDAWNARLTDYENERKGKALEWNALGFKNVIENAMGAFDKPKDNTEREIFAAKWQEAKTILQTSKFSIAASGGDIYPMSCIPNNLYQYKGIPWVKVTLNKDEIDALTNELIQNSGELNFDSIFGNNPIELDSISFEICRLILNRSWFQESLLSSRFWNYPDVLVSTGKKNNFEGLIPAYPIEFILVKNVIPVLSPNSPQNETIINSVKAGLPVFMGPFLLKSTLLKDLQNNPLQIQTFTSKQLNVIAKTMSHDEAVNPAREFSRIKGIQMLHKTRILKDTPHIVVRDHRLVDAGIAHLPDPAARPGFVWVTDHWEREKAEHLVKVKITGKIVDENKQPISEAEISILSTVSPMVQNDLTDNNGIFIIENIAKGNYHLTVKKNGYSVIEKEINISGDLDMGIINITSVNPVEYFFLLGVVYKKLPPLPNPIPNETYS